jgi:hypothetical protein
MPSPSTNYRTRGRPGTFSTLRPEHWI